jgi:hypothetical protein
MDTTCRTLPYGVRTFGPAFLLACSFVSSAGLSMSPQVHAVESKPILNAFNAVTAAIGGAFDRDTDRSRFPPPLRQVVFEDLTEIRSGMLALIRNTRGIQEGQRADVARLTPDLHVIRGIMKADAPSEQALARYQEKVAVILPTITADGLPVAASPPTVTGQNLPQLLRDAIVTLAPDIARIQPTTELVATDVVLIRDLRGFGEQQRIAGALQTSQLSEELRMFVIANRPPIFVIEDRPDMLAALALYERGKDLYLRYTFAAMLGHEWRHAFLHERGEVKPYSFELALLRAYLAKGLLPPECITDIKNTEKRLLEAQRAEAGGEDPTLRLFLKK